MSDEQVVTIAGSPVGGGRKLQGWTTGLSVLLLLLAGGCVRTTQPVLEDQQVMVDNGLAGRWVSEEGEETVDVQPAGADKIYKVLYTDKEGKKAPLLARLGKVGNLTIAEFQAEETTANASDVYKFHRLPLYTFLVIHQTTPRLVVSTMPQEWLKQYLVGHPGELQVAELGNEELLVTAPTSDFQRFLLNHAQDEGVFGDPKDRKVFVRPGDPTTRQAAK